jgi:hypothetical protein
LGSSIQPFVPGAPDVIEEALKRTTVPGNSIVLVMPLQLKDEPSMLIANWKMTILSAPFGYTLHSTSESILGCLAFYRPAAAPRSRPVMPKP